MRKQFYYIIICLLLFNATAALLQGQESIEPFEMIEKMGRGINLGNVLEAPDEGDWASPAKEFYFDDYKKAGFTNVRIPVRWDHHTDTLPPYSIDSSWLARVEEVVSWGLERDMVVVVNSHHDEWLMENYDAKIARLDSIWAQLARHFAHKSDDLVFEIFNEPHGNITSAQVDSMNQRILNTIRKTNPHRYVIIGGNEWNGYWTLINEVDIPHDTYNDPPHIIGTFHNYNPYEFGIGDGRFTWGDETDKQENREFFNQVNEWSENNKIPIYMGEYGAISTKERESVLRWYDFNTKEAARVGFATAAWDDGGDFSPYYRSRNYWDIAKLNRILSQGNYKNMDLTIPGTIQAEDFDTGGVNISYFDADSQNTLGFYRSDCGVEIDSIGNQEYAVILNNSEEWTEYTFNIDTTCKYKIIIWATTPKYSSFNSTSVTLDFNGINSTDSIPVFHSDTLQLYIDTLEFKAGKNQMRIRTRTPGLMIDKVEFDLLTGEPEDENLLSNPGFEKGTQDWTGNQCSLTAVEDTVYSGNYSLLVSDRLDSWAAPIQDITEAVLNAGKGDYRVTSHLKFKGESINDTAKITIALNFAESTNWISVTKGIDSNDWMEISGILSLDWGAAPQSVDFYVETMHTNVDFYTDDMELAVDSLYSPTNIKREDQLAVPRMKLFNYPNPSNPSTTIGYSIIHNEPVQLTIYNILGQRIRTLVNITQPQGKYKVKWNGKDRKGMPVPSGVYFYRLQQGSEIRTNKLMLIR